MSNPFLSVVTPAKNAIRFLGSCLSAVARVRGAGMTVEHVFVDGGSSDGTAETLRNTPDVTLYHEPDIDLVESVAYGIGRSTGEFVVLLMADDRLTDAFIAFARLVAGSHQPIDLALAPCLLVSDGEGAGRNQVLPVPTRVWDILNGYPGMNSYLFRRALWHDTDIPRAYPYTNDRLLMLRLLDRSQTLLIGAEPIAAMHVHDQSRTHAAGRDVRAIKCELNRLALDLLALNAGHRLEPVFALWAWRTALSLAKEALGDASARSRQQALGMDCIDWPRAATLARIPAGLFAVTCGHDRIYRPLELKSAELRIVLPALRDLVTEGKAGN